MKKIQFKFIQLIFGVVLLLVSISCIKNEEILFTDTLVEWDATTFNAKASGKEYALFTRVPVYGAAVNNAQPLITRTSGEIRLRVNLVGPQRSSAIEIPYSVVSAESTAVQGTHYSMAGTVTIPANSSFGEVLVNVLDAGASSGNRILVLQLDGNAEIQPSTRYRQVGLSINQQ
ncbi:hypothetical protein [Sphingobacterium bambusae]|uniref:DUF4843 domain-containing protein n=1 Tax=Sphingobacterium bambusae TaxID=662858 RepID=A0ABW6B894_9SPHI|nr:hypothetical protein [Sphingobacterium bambusae]WPL49129.1 hypothetical protein SCB77_01450 [Sphingobacterium bambusae]